MLKKSIAFGLLAATLILAPGAVSAQNQSTENDSSVKNQTSIMRSTRVQKSVTGRSHRGYSCPSTKANEQQSQDSRQTSVQEGVAENNSTNTQNVDSISSQVQRIRTRVLCR